MKTDAKAKYGFRLLMRRDDKMIDTNLYYIWFAKRWSEATARLKGCEIDWSKWIIAPERKKTDEQHNKQ